MFHNITKTILAQMKALETVDARDRQDGTPRLNRMRQVPPETGKFLALMAVGVPSGAWLELGTSGGYSALWISLAAKFRGTKLTTFELLPDKVEIARKTFRRAKVENYIEIIHGDARGHISDYQEIAFCFLDAEKEMYQEFYDLVVPRLVPGGVLLADNAINFKDDMQEMLTQTESDERVDTMIVPVGKGVLLARKI